QSRRERRPISYSCAACFDDEGRDYPAWHGPWPRLRPDAQLLRPAAAWRTMRPLRQLRAARARLRGCRRPRSLAMNQERLYYTDSYLVEFDAVVQDVVQRGDRWEVTLDRTAFYPTSGGQPYDTGTLGEAKVLDVFDQEN